LIRLDHILWAAPDLDAGTATIERLTGGTPLRGGSHPGLGTRNSLLALDGGTYFEVIAPDPAQELAGNRGGRIAAQARPGIMSFALNSTDLPALRDAASRAGLATDGPVAMHRSKPDGSRLDWSILDLSDPAYGEAIPFAIDWGATPHPSGTTPRGCRLRSFAVLHPDPAPLARLFEALGVPVAVRGAVSPGFLAVLDTPRGEVVLTHP
jgi:hypothetical protein